MKEHKGIPGAPRFYSTSVVKVRGKVRRPIDYPEAGEVKVIQGQPKPKATEAEIRARLMFGQGWGV